MPAANDPHQRRLDSVEVRPSWGRHVVGIDGLRGFAAVGVLLIHVRGLMMPNAQLDPLTRLVLSVGGEGLTLFFAISGFLLYRQFATSLIANVARPDVARYAMNRALRIYPVYLFVLLISSLVIGTANFAPLRGDVAGRADRVGFMTDPALLGVNATMLQTLFPGLMQTGLGVAWSLTVELIFYIVMPLLAIGAALSFRRRSLIVALVPPLILLLVGVATRIASRPLFAGLFGADAQVALWGDTWTAVLARSFFYNADLFAFGMMAAALLEHLRHGGRISVPPRFVRPIVMVGGIAAALVGYLGVLGETLTPTVWALSFGALLFFVAMPNEKRVPGFAAQVLESPLPRYFGIVSYSVYLWHISVIWLMQRFGVVVPGDGSSAFWANAAITILATLLLATGSYFAVERPALRLKTRRVARPAASGT